MTLLNQLLKTLVFVSLLVSLSACVEDSNSKNTNPVSPALNGGLGQGDLNPSGGDPQPGASTIGTAEGKGDSGGTTNKVSTIEQVRSTIMEVRQELIDNEMGVLWRFQGEFGYAQEDLANEMLRRIFLPLVYVMNEKAPKPIEEMDTDEFSEWLDYSQKWGSLDTVLENTKINLIEDHCYEMDGSEADASVEKFDFGTDICFSLTRMQRIPPESLKKHLYAVWLHELAHVFGYIDEARILEDYILFVYDQTTVADVNKVLHKISQIGFSAGLYISTLRSKQIPQAMSCGQIDARLEMLMERIPTNEEPHVYLRVHSTNEKDFYTAVYMYEEIFWELKEVCRDLLKTNSDYEFTDEDHMAVSKKLHRANHFLELYLLGRTNSIYSEDGQYEGYPLTLDKMESVRKEYENFESKRRIWY